MLFSVFPQFRLVVKTALKLLLVFVEYTECNTLLLIQAVENEDNKAGMSTVTKKSKLFLEDFGTEESKLILRELKNKIRTFIREYDTEKIIKLL